MAKGIWPIRRHQSFDNWPQTQLVALQTTGPYAASPGELVPVDATLGDVTVNAPASPALNDILGVYKVDDTAGLVIVSGNGNPIAIPRSGVSPASTPTDARLIAQDETAHWIWNGAYWMPICTANLIPYYEIWTATPINDVAFGVTIQWNFQPNKFTSTSLLFSHAAGILTATAEFDFSLTLQVVAEFILSGNNQDALLYIDDTFTATGGGSFALGRWASSMAHSRSGTFYDGKAVVGLGEIKPNDTLEFVATDDAGQSGTTDLLEASLLIEV